MNEYEIDLIKSYYDTIETNKTVTILDSTNKNIYSSKDYAQLFSLLPADLCGKNLRELTDNKYALAMVTSSQYYLRTLHLSGAGKAIGIIKYTSPVGVKIFSFEAVKLKSLFKIEFVELSDLLIIDSMNLLNQIINRRTNQHKVDVSLVRLDKTRPQLAESREILLFLLALGKSYKEIASILSDMYKSNFTDVKVRGLVHNSLFGIFQVTSVQELINSYLTFKVNYPATFRLFSTINFDGVLAINYL